MINEIKINGKIEINDPIDPEQEYSIFLERVQNDQAKVNSWINSQEEKVNTFTMINLGCAEIRTQDKKIIGIPKKGSQSQVLKFKIRELWENGHSGVVTEEQFYNEYMQKFIEEIQEKINYYLD